MSERERLAGAEGGPSTWAAHCPPKLRRILMVGLVSCFFLQTTFVYMDPSDETPLSPAAEEGRRVWLENNCQTCHQFYGFGGFLGPDLTNAHPRMPEGRLEAVITEGSGLMPPFSLSSAEIDALGEFLAAMNETGQGQAKMRTGGTGALDPAEAYRVIEEAMADADPADQQDYDVYWESGCDFCHEPFRASLVGAPDLTGVLDRLSEAEVERILADGKGEMPPAELSAEARASVLGYLRWLRANRADLADELGIGESAVDGVSIWSQLPWWEFR